MRRSTPASLTLRASPPQRFQSSAKIFQTSSRHKNMGSDSSFPMATLQEQFGDIDIYLFDQILRGNISSRMKVFDAGCGFGRNIVYLLREGYEIFGADPDPKAIDAVRRLAPHIPADNFRVEAVEA